MEVQSEEHVWLPAWVFVPRAVNKTKPVLLMLNASGRNAYWQEGQVYQTLAERGYLVCAADLRGTGDLTPEYGRGAAGYQRSHQSEENYAWASMMLGKPLLGQRVTDILALAAALRSTFGTGGATLQVNANGPLTVPALCSVVVDPLIDSLFLSGGLISFESILHVEQYTVPFANFCPAVLNHTDLPMLVNEIAPRKVTMAGCVDAAGRAVDSAAVRQAYSEALGKGHLTIRPDPDWSFGDLAG